MKFILMMTLWSIFMVIITVLILYKITEKIDEN